MKIAVIGSRNFTNDKLMDSELKKYKSKVKLIISGGAKGADSLAEKWAIKNNVITKMFRPDVAKFAAGAHFERNKAMVYECELLIAFWDGKSKGTKFTVDFARSNKKRLVLIIVD
jgi:hypothetical protein